MLQQQQKYLALILNQNLLFESKELFINIV